MKKTKELWLFVNCQLLIEAIALDEDFDIAIRWSYAINSPARNRVFAKNPVSYISMLI